MAPFQTLWPHIPEGSDLALKCLQLHLMFWSFFSACAYFSTVIPWDEEAPQIEPLHTLLQSSNVMVLRTFQVYAQPRSTLQS